ncbi:MAG: ATPase domain-containing protein [Candidatus Thermoplasmatota archaeon]
MVKKPRCKTGIKNLDAELHGGIPIGNTVLVSGASGVGKTTFSMQFLTNGVRENEKGVFFTSSESVDMLKKHQNGFDYFDPKMVKSGQLTILDIWNISDRLGLNPLRYTAEEAYVLFEVIRDIVKEIGAKRLVIDSMTSLCYRLPSVEMIRDFIFTLGSHLSAMRCTTVLTSEIPPMKYRFSQNDVEEFISDGIIFMGDKERGGDLIRTLQIIKMRGIAHGRNKYMLNISAQNGIELAPLFKSSL